MAEATKLPNGAASPRATEFRKAVYLRILDYADAIHSANAAMVSLASKARETSWTVDQIRDLLHVFEQSESLCLEPAAKASALELLQEQRLQASREILHRLPLPHTMPRLAAKAPVQDRETVTGQLQAVYLDLYVCAFAHFLEVVLDSDITEQQVDKALGGIQEHRARFQEACLSHANDLGISKSTVRKVKASCVFSTVGAIVGGVIGRGFVGRRPIDEAMMGPRGGLSDILGANGQSRIGEDVFAAQSCTQPFVACLESLSALCFDFGFRS